MFSLDGHLYTADQIRADPKLFARTSGAFIDPHDINYEIIYSAISPPLNPFTPYVAVTLPAGRHMRLITLVDRQQNNYLRINWSSEPYPKEQFSDLPFQGAEYDDVEGNWLSTPVIPYRTVNGHLNIGALACKPDVGLCPYPQEEAIILSDLSPYPATIYFP